MPNWPLLYQLNIDDPNGLQTWVVDGNYIRSNIDADFTEGGNDQAYPDFVPQGQIWVDSETAVAEWDFIILHEKTERQAMKEQGLNYAAAHDWANQVELKARQEKQGANPQQAMQGTQENSKSMGMPDAVIPNRMGGKQMPYTNVPESLWEKMDSCVEQVQKKEGVSKESAVAICYDTVVGGKAYLEALKAHQVRLTADLNALEPPAVKMGKRNNSKDVQRLKQIQTLVTELLSDEESEPDESTQDSGKSVDLVSIGGEIKSLSATGEVGGYLVRWGSPQEKDLEGDYFTKNTYFGARDGDGADTFMNHCIPLGKGLEEFSDWVGKPIKATRDAIGLFAKTVLDLSDEYEKIIFDLVQKGKLKWSSGTASHLVKRTKDGQIKRWIISDASFTPIPAEWRESNKVYPIKSYQEMFEKWSAEGLVNLAKATDPSVREIPDDLKREAEMLKALAGAS